MFVVALYLNMSFLQASVPPISGPYFPTQTKYLHLNLYLSLLLREPKLRHTVQFSSVAQSCPTLQPHESQHTRLPCPSPTQAHIHQVSDAIQPSHPLSSPSPAAPNPSQHQSLFQSQLFTWGSQSIGVSAPASVLPKNTQD